MGVLALVWKSRTLLTFLRKLMITRKKVCVGHDLLDVYII